MARNTPKVALTQTPVHILDHAHDSFTELRATYKARRDDLKHPDGHLSSEEFAELMGSLKVLESERREQLRIVAAVVRGALGISKGLDPKDFDVVYGETSADGIRATLWHRQDAVRGRIQAFGPSTRALDAFTPPPNTRMWFATLTFPEHVAREDGMLEETRKVRHMPLDIISAIQNGWFAMDLEDREERLFYMAPGRAAHRLMYRREYANVLFRENRGGKDAARRFIGRHPDSGKLVFARDISEEFVRKPGRESQDTGKPIGVQTVERLSCFEVALVNTAGVYPEEPSDADWAAREQEIVRNLYKLDLLLDESLLSNQVRIGPFVFDAATLLGLTEVTVETVGKAEAKVSRGGRKHAEAVLTGELVLVGKACRAPITDAKAVTAWLEQNGADLVKDALAKLGAIVAAPTPDPKADGGSNDTSGNASETGSGQSGRPEAGERASKADIGSGGSGDGGGNASESDPSGQTPRPAAGERASKADDPSGGNASETDSGQSGRPEAGDGADSAPATT